MKFPQPDGVTRSWPLQAHWWLIGLLTLLTGESLQHASAQQPLAPGADRASFADGLLLNRDLLLELNRTRKLVVDGHFAEGFTRLKQILSLKNDQWVALPPPALPRSCWGLAREILLAAGPPGWQAYDEEFGADALRELKALTLQQKPQEWLRIMQIYPCTTAGFLAGDAAAAWYLDHGEPSAATAIWKRLASEPWHRERFQPTHLIQWQLASAWAGISFEKPEHLQWPATTTVRWGGRDLPWTQVTKLIPSGKSESYSHLWQTYQGNSRRNASVAGSLPALQPEVVIPLFDSQASGVTDNSDSFRKIPAVLQLPEVAEELGLQPAAFGSGGILSSNELTFPQSGDAITAGRAAWGLQGVSVSGLVIFRDWTGIRCIDPPTGKTQWHYPTRTSFLSLMSSLDEQQLADDPGLRASVNKAFRTNSLLGWLTTDGSQLFFLDDLDVFGKTTGAEAPAPARPPVGDPDAVRARTDLPWNRLVSLPLHPATTGIPQPIWTGGGPGEATPAEPLRGHFFLGPPVVSHQSLYVLAEANQLINLLCLQPHTGQVIWSQPLLVVNRSRQIQDLRLRIACQPTVVGDTVLCPTHNGLVVAASALSGELLWIADLREGNPRWMSRSYNTAVLAGEAADVPLTVQAQGGSVLVLDVHTPRLHCFDTVTGAPRWSVDAAGARYLATMTPDLALVVTGIGCSAVSLTSGQKLWSTELGPPAGTGFRMGKEYLLPLADGQIVLVDLLTGRTQGYSPRETRLPVGNLLPAGEQIVSLSSRAAMVLPQSQALLERLQQSTNISPATELQVASTLLRLGRIADARAKLDPIRSKARDPEFLSQMRHIYRNAIWTELQQQPDLTPQRREQWLSLTETDAERAQVWYVTSEWAARNREWETAWVAAQELSRTLTPHTLLDLPDQQGHRVTGEVWLESLQRKLPLGMHTQGNPNSASSSSSTVVATTTARNKTADSDERVEIERELLRHPASSTVANQLRNELGEIELSLNNAQKAEILWLRTSAQSSQSETADDPASAEALRQLAEMYDRQGLYAPAGRILHQLRSQFANVRLSDGQTATDYVNDLPPSHLSSRASRRYVPLEWPVEQVRIEEERETEQLLLKTDVGSFRRSLFPTWMPLGIAVLDRGFSDNTSLSLVDRETGINLTDLKLPPRSYVTSSTAREPVGHLVTITSSEGLHGISLLERDFVWKQSLNLTREAIPLVRTGPCTPRQIIAQTSSRLIALDPLDGEIRWERQHLDPEEGLFKDPLWGIFGDDETLVVSRPNRRQYRVFRTIDGTLLREGEFLTTLQDRMNFGRKLAYRINEKSGEWFLCLWDPLTDEFLFRRRISEMAQVSGSLSAGEFTLADPATDRVEVIDGHTGKVKLDVKLPVDTLLAVQSVRVFQDAQRYFLYVQKNLPGTTTRSPYSDNVWLPLTQLHIAGDLVAVDKQSQQVMWTRNCMPSSWLDLSEYHLPIVILLSQTQRSGISVTRGLTIEVLDAATGHELALHRPSRAEGQYDRLLVLDYQRDPGRLVLSGPQVRFTIDFSRETQQRFPGE